MRRAFGYEVLACPRRRHAMRLIALIKQPEIIRRILLHVGEPLDVPAPTPSLAPLFLDDADDPSSAPRYRIGEVPQWAPTYEEPC
jgi:hypothetical protein